MQELSLVCVRDDAAIGERLAEALERYGLRLCRSANVFEEFQGYGAVIVLMSPAAMRSQLVSQTAERAMDWGKLVPVFVNLCQLPSRMSGLCMHDLSGWDGAAEDRVVLAIVTHVRRMTGVRGGKPQLGPPMPRPPAIEDHSARYAQLSYDDSAAYHAPAYPEPYEEAPYGGYDGQDYAEPTYPASPAYSAPAYTAPASPAPTTPAYVSVSTPSQADYGYDEQAYAPEARPEQQRYEPQRYEPQRYEPQRHSDYPIRREAEEWPSRQYEARAQEDWEGQSRGGREWSRQSWDQREAPRLERVSFQPNEAWREPVRVARAPEAQVLTPLDERGSGDRTYSRAVRPYAAEEEIIDVSPPRRRGLPGSLVVIASALTLMGMAVVEEARSRVATPTKLAAPEAEAGVSLSSPTFAEPLPSTPRGELPDAEAVAQPNQP